MKSRKLPKQLGCKNISNALEILEAMKRKQMAILARIDVENPKSTTATEVKADSLTRRISCAHIGGIENV